MKIFRQVFILDFVSAYRNKSPKYTRSIEDMVTATIALLDIQLKDLTEERLPQIKEAYLKELDDLSREADVCNETDGKQKDLLDLVQVALHAKKSASIFRPNQEMKYVLGQELVVRRIVRILQKAPDAVDS